MIYLYTNEFTYYLSSKEKDFVSHTIEFEEMDLRHPSYTALTVCLGMDVPEYLELIKLYKKLQSKNKFSFSNLLKNAPILVAHPMDTNNAELFSLYTACKDYFKAKEAFLVNEAFLCFDKHCLEDRRICYLWWTNR